MAEFGRSYMIRDNKGFALMIVIVVMLLASFLASQLILSVKTELVISQNVKSRIIGNYLAEAGMNMAIFRVLGQTPLDLPAFGEEEEWLHFFEGFQYEFFLPLGRVTYYAVSESGKIDLNRSPPRLIELFLEYKLGEEKEEEIATIMDSLLDWRDNDDLHRLNGAESEFYESLDDPYIARNGALEDVNEFFLIHGTESLAGQFDAMDVFSVYNAQNNGKININSLTPAMLNFLSNNNSEAVEAYREAKKEFEGKLPLSVMTEILGEERYGELSPFFTNTSSANKFFFIVGTGQPGLEENAALDPESPRKTAGSQNSVIIQKNGTNYTFMTWQERYI